MNKQPESLTLDNPIYFTKLCAYRIIIAVLLFVMHFIKFEQPLLGSYDPNLYIATLLVYTLTNVALLLSSLSWPLGQRPVVGIASIFLDIGSIYLLKFSSAETAALLPLLLVLVVVVSSLSLNERMAKLTTAMASIAVLAEQTNLVLYHHAPIETLFDAGAYGTVFFITLISLNRLVTRTHTSETVISEQAADIERLEEINQRIVQKMHTGIIVLDNNQNITTINIAAMQLLNDFSLIAGQKVPAAIKHHLQQWLESHRYSKSRYIKSTSNSIQLKLNFTSLDESESPTILIFIEDMKLLNQQAQSLKLASLGRLAGSIAHEIRNPLSAISHASQLLSENIDPEAKNSRLTEIIQNQSQRIDHIIENVQLLSRRETSNIDTFNINYFLENIIEENKTLHNRQAEIAFIQPATEITVRCDQEQLSQVINNLIENGLRYSHQHTSKYTLTIELQTDTTSKSPIIDVIDDGNGIEPNIAEHLFEPFVTSEHNGSGLGLYISRELCEANQLHLFYKKSADNKTCFRILFPHPQKEL